MPIKAKPIAALLHLRKEEDREAISLGTNLRFIEIIERSRARAKREGTVPLDQVRKRLGIPAKRRRRKAKMIRAQGTA